MNVTEDKIRDHYDELGQSERFYDAYKNFVIDRV